jgi:hypothetical protein
MLASILRPGTPRKPIMPTVFFNSAGGWSQPMMAAKVLASSTKRALLHFRPGTEL